MASRQGIVLDPEPSSATARTGQFVGISDSLRQSACSESAKRLDFAARQNVFREARMQRTQPTRLAILGGGPIGLEAALYARAAGLEVTLFERGAIAENLQHWGFLRMFSPFGMNTTRLGLALLSRERPKLKFPPESSLLTGREFREAYLLPLAESSELADCIHLQTQVIAIGRSGILRGEAVADPRKSLPPFRILVQDSQKQERLETADVIFDCTGTYGHPRVIGDGGVPAVGERASAKFLAYGPVDVLGSSREQYAGKSIVVIGAGYTAATMVCDLATLAEQEQATWIIWLTRGSRGSQPLTRIPSDPLKERDRLAARANALASRGDGNLEHHPQTFIDEIVCDDAGSGFSLRARVAGKPFSWNVERVIAAVGYRPDLTFCQELQLQESWSGIETTEPGYYILGAKSRGRDSNFLLRDGHEQIRLAVAAITGKPGLDLYRSKAA